MFDQKSFEWNEEKNQKLQQERGLSFEAVIVAIENGHLLAVLESPTKSNQKIFEVEMQGYVVRIPFAEDERKIFLKTAYHSRKATKRLLKN